MVVDLADDNEVHFLTGGMVQGSSPHIPEPDYDLSDENGSYSGSEGSWRGDPQQGGDQAWRDTATLRYILSLTLSVSLFVSFSFLLSLSLSFHSHTLVLFYLHLLK